MIEQKEKRRCLIEQHRRTAALQAHKVDGLFSATQRCIGVKPPQHCFVGIQCAFGSCYPVIEEWVYR